MGVRLALFANLMLVVGLATFPLHASRPGKGGEREAGQDFTTPLRWLCATGLLVSLAGIAILTASMQGVGLLAVDPDMIFSIVSDSEAGTAWLVRIAALVSALVATLWSQRKPGAAGWVIAGTGSIALATLVWSGHAGATDGLAGTIHRASDALHMIAAAVWLGAIAAFLLLLRTSGQPDRRRVGATARSLDQFARVGTICVIVIAATGLLNGQMIIGVQNIGSSLASPYGQLLLAKLVLFALMLGLAAANRWRLTPALRAAVDDPEKIEDTRPASALAAMRRSLWIEALAGLAILALVAWFGTLEPYSTG